MAPAGGSYRDKKRLDARVEGLLGLPGDRTPSTRGGLHVVRPADDPTLAVMPGPAPPSPASHPATPQLRVVRTDDQARFSAARVLRTLGWDTTSVLQALVDLPRHIAWVQLREVATRGHDLDGTPCDCDRCTEQPAEPPGLPGAPVTIDEDVGVDRKGQLCLTRGLLSAAGLPTPAEAAVVVLPALQAVAVVSPLTLLAGGLRHLLGGTGDLHARSATGGVAPSGSRAHRQSS